MRTIRRSWFRFAFSLRALLVIVTILCTCLAYQVNWIRQRREFLATEVNTVDTGLEYGSFDGQRQVRAPGALFLFGEEGIGRMNFSFVFDFDRPLTQIEFEQAFPKSEHARRLSRAQKLFPEASVTWGWTIRIAPRAT